MSTSIPTTLEYADVKNPDAIARENEASVRGD